MKKLFFTLLFFSSFFSFSQKYQITDDFNYFTTHKNINHSFTKIEMMNDFNPIYSKHTNDDGYTLGVSIFSRVKSKNSPNFIDIDLRSDLYTQYQRDKIYNIGTRQIFPQNFVEKSYLNIQYQYFIPTHNLFLSMGGGIGINNQKNAINGLALYFQGGVDGKGGYHALLNNNPGTENLATGNIDPLFFINPSIIKQFSFNYINNTFSKPYIELQPGFRLGTKNIGNAIFFNTKIEVPLTQLVYKQSNIFLFNLLLQNQLIYHTNGFLMLPEYGAEVQLSVLSLGFTSIFTLGKQEIDTYKYLDKEVLMRLYLKANF